jgi:catechol 2,3-dioxygenase-like lactoylglutathione lyase family enzyme
MPGVVGAHHTSFTVANLEPSLEFFRDLLGLELVYVREIQEDYFRRIVGVPNCVVRAALLRIPGERGASAPCSPHHVELFEYVVPRGQPVHPRPCDPGSVHLSLLVDDLPSFYEQLKGRGVDAVSSPVLITTGPNRGGYGIYLKDPNGILIELFQPPPSSAP